MPLSFPAIHVTCNLDIPGPPIFAENPQLTPLLFFLFNHASYFFFSFVAPPLRVLLGHFSARYLVDSVVVVKATCGSRPVPQHLTCHLPSTGQGRKEQPPNPKPIPHLPNITFVIVLYTKSFIQVVAKDNGDGGVVNA